MSGWERETDKSGAGVEDKVAFVWKVADKLRGHLKPHEYGSAMLPLIVLRRLNAVLADRKHAVVARAWR